MLRDRFRKNEDLQDSWEILEPALSGQDEEESGQADDGQSVSGIRGKGAAISENDSRKDSRQSGDDDSRKGSRQNGAGFSGKAVRQTEPASRQKKKRPRVPDGMFRKCTGCGKIVYEDDVRAEAYCCPECGCHFRIEPRERLRMTIDRG
ncbi:MAG: hypothetical protein LIO94_03380, partial [Clostridiales bacterium]|nr:hypothetical protein [Clostridiales bacterium]